MPQQCFDFGTHIIPQAFSYLIIGDWPEPLCRTESTSIIGITEDTQEIYDSALIVSRSGEPAESLNSVLTELGLE